MGIWTHKIIRAVRILLPFVILSAAAPLFAEKVKRERAQVALPIIVEASSDPAPGSYTFRAGEFWGGQPVRYRSAVVLNGGVPVPEIGPGIGIQPGEQLIELQATSRAWSGSLYCKSQIRWKKLPPVLLCVADRNGDGSMDQLWAAVAASSRFVVPYPDIRSLRAIEPTPFEAVEDRSSLSLQFGFFVSGTNPIFGVHHFYPMLSEKGEVGHVMMEEHKSISVSELPKEFTIGGGRIRITGFRQGNYEASVIGRLPPGERMIVSAYPKQTIYISVPG
jgi:hypothetical protein